MGAAERLLEVAQRLNPDELAQVLHLAEYLAKRPKAVDPSLGLAWLNGLPEEDEALTPGELANLRASQQEIAAGAPTTSLESLEAEYGLAP